MACLGQHQAYNGEPCGEGQGEVQPVPGSRGKELLLVQWLVEPHIQELALDRRCATQIPSEDVCGAEGGDRAHRLHRNLHRPPPRAPPDMPADDLLPLLISAGEQARESPDAASVPASRRRVWRL